MLGHSMGKLRLYELLRKVQKLLGGSEHTAFETLLIRGNHTNNYAESVNKRPHVAE